MDTNLNVVNNSERNRFEIELDNGAFAVLDYRLHKGNLALMHTEVPASHQGHGIAARLAHAALEHAKRENMKVMVVCEYVGVYLKRHPEYIELLDQSYKNG